MPSPTAVRCCARRTRAGALAACIGTLALVALPLLAAPALAAPPAVRPWTPSGVDSLTSWAANARARFRANTGDSLGGTNFQAYSFAANIARQLIKSLGRENMTQVYAIQPVLDSLGMDTEVTVDPSLPYFAMVMIHNPFRKTAAVGGFLYWYSSNDLRMQGVQFESGRNILTRVWRTGYALHPYSWGVVENARFGTGPLRFTLLRLSQNGYYWTADQYPGAGPEFDTRGDATFTDVNNDGVPELITWNQTAADSVFTECMGCPRLTTERTWVERENGFELNEARLVPSTYATWVLFLGLLRSGSAAGAGRLLADPSRVSEAIANRWDKGAGKGLWQLVSVEPNTTWPHWMVVRRGHGAEAQSWVVHFILKDGRWIIRDWIKEKSSAPKIGVR